MKNIDRFMAACAALMLVVACGGGSGKGSGSDQEAAPGEPAEAPKSEPTTEPTTEPTPAPPPSYHVSSERLRLDKGPEEADGKPFMMMHEGVGFFDVFASESSFEAADFAASWENGAVDALCGDFIWIRADLPDPNAPPPSVEEPYVITNVVIAIGQQGQEGYWGNVAITSFANGVIEGTYGWGSDPETDFGSFGAFQVPVWTPFEIFPE